MANTYDSVSVDTNATLVVAKNRFRRGVTVYNNGTAIVYIGFDDAVDATSGMPLIPRATASFNRVFDGLRGSIYGIAASGTQDVRYMEWES